MRRMRDAEENATHAEAIEKLEALQREAARATARIDGESAPMPGVVVKPSVLLKAWSLPSGVPGATAYMDPVTKKISQDSSGVPLYDNKSDLMRTARATKDQFVHKRLVREDS